MEMLARFARHNPQKSFFVKDISGMVRMNQYNQYMRHWPIVLKALRRLWELGKVSELKSPFYEPVEKPANK
ncbi:MAG TPA: hypothetical protein VF918_05115 [Anaerolineales bacterium]